MVRKKKKLTALEKKYNQQRKRIQRFISIHEKRGYSFENVLPDKPKKITQASVRRLEKITPQYLYQRGQYGGELSYGEIVSAKRGLILEKQEHKRVREERKLLQQREIKARQYHTNSKGFKVPTNISSDKSLFDYSVIQGFRINLLNYNEHANLILNTWLDKVLAIRGVHDTAIMLERGAEAGYLVNRKIVYDSTQINNYMSAMLDYLPDVGPLTKSEIMEAMEEEEFNEY